MTEYRPTISNSVTSQKQLAEQVRGWTTDEIVDALNEINTYTGAERAIVFAEIQRRLEEAH